MKGCATCEQDGHRSHSGNSLKADVCLEAWKHIRTQKQERYREMHWAKREDDLLRTSRNRRKKIHCD